ncbi:SigE family RNA polymerase sigma factor [Frankia sp. CNm7]|uniref:SigE family RNA polymerase sigma factor n=1 Tax=Frankia nepalensis TaxID=1836974 RepID=A0A937RKE2_9ACTN|nr:SigE family RNA polymerase sigma factor [Frankia nepalensis]MBL7498603.1 SigE family RNA polymerase sigma factor [Frankia nepalensis]MBL7510472.1 SigE family RNA polymerase sigma factor [Frankia nepalensis]MBL7517188.1 SigE family RNA polymerase sigma factor [Frankia nepalensis]MBL7630520.1 SigE family RNA polymerase sigma factor [Frankia nepalensis]
MPADDASFERFVADCADRLLLSAVLLVGGDWAAGEDLLQGAFERTYRHWGRMNDPKPEAYVRRALVNAATSRWRTLRARVGEVPLFVDGEWTADPADPGAGDPADRLAAHEALIRALRALPPRQRAVLVLRYFDDLPEADVAAVLGCTVGTVRSQASRGLAKLRDSHPLRGFAPSSRAPTPPVGPLADVLTNEPADTVTKELDSTTRPAPARRARGEAQ